MAMKEIVGKISDNANLTQQEVLSRKNLTEPFSFILPRTKAVCIQGPTTYMKKVLHRLRLSPFLTGWQEDLHDGLCTENGYTQGGGKETCFPKATLHMDNDMKHRAESATMDFTFIQEYMALSAPWHGKMTMTEVMQGLIKTCLPEWSD